MVCRWKLRESEEKPRGAVLIRPSVVITLYWLSGRRWWEGGKVEEVRCRGKAEERLGVRAADGSGAEKFAHSGFELSYSAPRGGTREEDSHPASLSSPSHSSTRCLSHPSPLCSLPHMFLPAFPALPYTLSLVYPHHSVPIHSSASFFRITH